MTLQLISVEEAALHLKVAEQTVRLWARQGRFRWFKLGSRMVIDQEDLEKFVTAQQRGRPVEMAS